MVAIVTGGAGAGIGQGITRVLCQRKWSLLIVDRDQQRMNALKNELNESENQVETLVDDITLPQTAESAVNKALQQFGRLDGLVNNAGIGLCKPLGDVTDEEFDGLLDADLRSAFRFTRAALPALIKSKGAIVSVGSVHATASIRGYAPYAAAKAGLQALMRGTAIDYGPLGVRANTVNPGLVMSPQSEALIRSFHPDPHQWVTDYTSRKQLLPTLVSAEQVGETIAWLLSPQACSITGQAITIDGGTSVMLYERESLLP